MIRPLFTRWDEIESAWRVIDKLAAEKVQNATLCI